MDKKRNEGSERETVRKYFPVRRVLLMLSLFAVIACFCFFIKGQLSNSSDYFGAIRLNIFLNKLIFGLVILSMISLVIAFIPVGTINANAVTFRSIPFGFPKMIIPFSSVKDVKVGSWVLTITYFDAALQKERVYKLYLYMLLPITKIAFLEDFMKQYNQAKNGI